MANDFSNDSNCVALWRFESGALTADSKGTNTLVTGNGGPVADTGDFKEGAASADFVPARHLALPQASSSVSYPFRSDNALRKISLVSWCKMDTVVENGAIYSKWDSSAGKRCMIPIRTGSNHWQSFIAYNNGDSAETLYNAGTPATGRWYHVGYTFDASDKSWKLVIWDDTAQTKTVNTGGNATNAISVEDNRVLIASGYDSFGSAYAQWDGHIDEMVVFNDILMLDEIDLIRQGQYPGKVGPFPTHIQVAE